MASYVDKRSGISVAWSAPAINTVFYRYTPEEVRFWLVYGRANSPMPAWGLAGGEPGALGHNTLIRADGSTHDLGSRAEAWRPWRAYAALLLWGSLAGSGG